MSFNPDEHNQCGAENSSQDIVISNLQEENTSLKSQIEELSRRLSQYEISAGQAAAAAGGGGYNHPTNIFRRYVSDGSNYRGRKSIPFSSRNEKQHQGRIAYLLKLLQKGSTQLWNQDLIVDLQEYCSSDADFFKQALQMYGLGGNDEINMDTFIAMLQSHV